MFEAQACHDSDTITRPISAAHPNATGDPFKVRLGVVVRVAIKDAGRTQRDVATAAGISPRSLDRILAGVGPMWCTDLHMIAVSLGVRTSSLVRAAEGAIPTQRGSID